MGEEFVLDDEFHETFEEIGSTSGFESDEDDRSGLHGISHVTQRNHDVEDVAPIWTPSSLQSKFLVWKDDTLSVNDRRRQFFKQMGLRSSRDESFNGSTLFSNGVAKTRSKTSWNLGEEEASVAIESVNATRGKCLGKQKNCAHLDGETSRTDAQRASKPLQIGCNSKLDNAPSTSYQVHIPNAENSPDECHVVPSEGKREPGLTSAEFSTCTGHKTCDSAESFSKDCAQENVGNGAGNGSGNVVVKLDGQCASSLDDEPGVHDDDASSSQEKHSQSLGANLGSECASPRSVIENITEEHLKIRDLDSGKEFLMKRFNRDGSLNMLREVATGKDLTLAEFETTLGLFSPVTQELHKREAKIDIKPPTSTQSKSWLKMIKSSLKTGSKDVSGSAQSVATFDASSQPSVGSTLSQVESLPEDGSPKRDSSFAGLDRNEFTRRGSLAIEDEDGNCCRKPQKVKVKVRRKKNFKEFTDLHLTQEIIAHQGAIWTMKFCDDGSYLASAGQDRVVNVWEVVDHPLMADSDLWKSFEECDGDLEQRAHSKKVCNDRSVKASQDRNRVKVDKLTKKKLQRMGKNCNLKKLKFSQYSKGLLPKPFWLSEKPMCSFGGHTEDILDLSWSQSQFLLSSSMDKTVRLWHISYDECLRVFSHNDYVTCAQFNPQDDRYFLSGSLDDKVRIWSIPEHHVVDWNDLQEMVTAICYTPDGKKAIVGSYKGNCRFYNATDGAGNKLHLDAHIDVRQENRKARGKKITGLHCMPGDPQKVLVTSNDSRVRIYDGLNLFAKYKGLRNGKSQISSSFSPAGDFIISASEDSRVLVWSSCDREVSTKTSIYWRDKQLPCAEFAARHVSVAIAWPGSAPSPRCSSRYELLAASKDFQITNELEPSPPLEENFLRPSTKDSDENSKCLSNCLGTSPLGIFGSGNTRKNIVAVADELTTSSTTKQQHGRELVAPSPMDSISSKVASLQSSVPSPEACEDSPLVMNPRSSFFPECEPKGSAITGPEEKLGNGSADLGSTNPSPVGEVSGVSAAWGLVIVTAALGGEITTFQNYGFPVRH